MGLSLKFGGKDAKNTPREKKEGGNEPKRYTVSFSLAGLISLTVLTLVALSWIFILGVLVGRGYKPETAVPELERIMPRAEEPSPQKADVLKAEELDFYSELSKKPGDQKKEAEAKQVVKQPVTRPEPVKPQPKPAAVTPKAPERPRVVVREGTNSTTERVYQYSYQVASLKDIGSARKFQDKLASLGLSSRLEKAQAKGTTWHRVIVSFRGTPTDTNDLMNKLGTLGIHKPLLKAKRPL